MVLTETETKTKSITIKSKSGGKTANLTVPAESNTKTEAAKVLKHWLKNSDEVINQLYLDEQFNIK
jgi:hypothetical protein